MDNAVLGRMLQDGSIATPCYVGSLKKLNEHIDKMLNISGDTVQYCYAMKANPFLAKYINEKINHIEVCSPGELKICVEMGIPGSSIVFSGVNKTERDIAEALDYNVDIITLESLKHFELVKRLCVEKSQSIKLLIRLSSGAQFGMEEAELCTIVERREEYPFLDIIGIHYFTGTQKKKIEKDIEEIELIAGLIERLKRDYNYRCQLFEYGLGLSVPYFEGDDFDNIYRDLEELVGYVAQANYDFNIVFELGRFFTASCMSYLTSIDDIKSVSGNNLCLVDGGIHHLNYYGQNMAMRVPKMDVISLGKSDSAYALSYNESGEWKICGSLCTFADILVRKAELGRMYIGDVLAFHNVGAYSITEAPALFLSRTMPNIYLLDQDNTVHTIRANKESYTNNMFV